MKKVFLFLMVIALTGCQNIKTVPGSESLLVTIQGKWSWSDAKELCVSRWHKIEPVKDNSYLLFLPHSEFEAVDGTTKKDYSYEILSVTDARIHLRLTHETRTDTHGNLITWYLVFNGNNEYRWQRSDWGGSRYTAPVYRCKT